MTSNFEDVGDFQHRFNLAHVDCSGAGDYDGTYPCNGPGPQPWDDELLAFRSKFLREELDEFDTGVTGVDHAQMADALVDLVYVAMGTAHLLGYPWQLIWDRVQAANMKKVRAAADGSDSRRGSPFDVMKPPGWEPPDVAEVLGMVGFDEFNEPPGYSAGLAELGYEGDG